MLTAFALGGLGGNNAQTAGFLAGTEETGLIPDLISTTSGTIYWVCEYLKGKDLNESFKDMPRDHNKLQRLFELEQWNKIFDVMKPAAAEYWLRWMKPWQPLDLQEWIDRIWPAQLMTEAHNDDWFADIARTLNDARIDKKEIGIVFNSFEPGTATEFLHANDKAFELLNKKVGQTGHGGVTFAVIDGRAVKDALRLFMYGFEGENRMDGGYHRQVILRDLHKFDRVYAVRPQSQRWLGPLPKNVFQLADLVTELWFNSSYAGEVAALSVVNELIEKERINPTEFKRVDIVEVSILRNRGFLDYLVENADVFDAAREQTRLILTEKAEQDSAKLKAELENAQQNAA